MVGVVVSGRGTILLILFNNNNWYVYIYADDADDIIRIVEAKTSVTIVFAFIFLGSQQLSPCGSWEGGIFLGAIWV